MLKIKALLAKMLSFMDGTKWADVPGKVGMNRLMYRLKSGTVFVNGYDNGQYTWTANTWILLGTLPDGARPSYGIYASGATRNGQTYEIQIGTDGKVQLYTNGTSGYKSFTVAFPLGL